MDETGREENGGCVWSTQRGARNTGRVCAEFVSRIRSAVHRGRVIGHSLFLRRDYARSIYRLYSIDYTNLYRRVLSFALFFGRAHVDERGASFNRRAVHPVCPRSLFSHLSTILLLEILVCLAAGRRFEVVLFDCLSADQLDGNDRTVIKLGGHNGRLMRAI